MAKIVTVQLMVDDDDEQRIAAGLNDMFQAAMQPVDPDQDKYGWLLDCRLTDKAGNLCMTDVPAEIADAVVNETYEPGDAFAGGEISLAQGLALDLAKLVTAKITISADPAQPGMFTWNGAEDSFASERAATADALREVNGQVMGFHDLSSEFWDSLSLNQQLELTQEAYAPPEPAVQKRRLSSSGLGL